MLDEPASAGLSPVLVDRACWMSFAELGQAGTAVLLVEQLVEKYWPRPTASTKRWPRAASCWKPQPRSRILPQSLRKRICISSMRMSCSLDELNGSARVTRPVSQPPALPQRAAAFPWCRCSGLPDGW